MILLRSPFIHAKNATDSEEINLGNRSGKQAQNWNLVAVPSQLQSKLLLLDKPNGQGEEEEKTILLLDMTLMCFDLIMTLDMRLWTY